MTDDKNTGLDPRFDPAFQRGFDPALPIETVVPAAPVPRTRPAAPVDRTVADSVPAPQVLPVEDVAPAVIGVISADSTAPTEADEPRELRASPARNPFVIVLAVLSIVLIIGGLWLFSWAQTVFNGSGLQSQGDYLALDAIIHSAPFISLLGLATLLGILFVFVARYRRS